jgi:Na+-driven multidrug efflux pump
MLKEFMYVCCREVQAAAMAPLVIIAAMQPVNAVVFIGDGVFQGAADFKYLALTMCLACSLSALVVQAPEQSLTTVWLAILTLQLGRCTAVWLRYLDAVPLAGSSPLKREQP